MSGTLRRLPRFAIAPSILTADFGRLAEEVRTAEASGAAAIHLDVMDGVFVPNISFGPLVVSAVNEATGLPLDVHLMIKNPERYVEQFVEAGADGITIHVEATAHVHRALQLIRAHDVDCGVALNPGTPLTALDELLPVVDLILVMSVNPGFGGQAFIPASIDKIRRLKTRLNERELGAVRIEVDGGISERNIRHVADAGAEIFVTGSSVFNDQTSVDESMAKLRDALGQGRPQT